MIHIGERRFYDTIRERLAQCEFVLYEGVSSFRGRMLTYSYRLVARRKRLGLVCQSDILRRRDIEARLVHADLTAPEFDRAWSDVPWNLRLAFAIGAPLYGAYRYLTATRASLARRAEVETFPSRDEILRWTAEFDPVEAALLTQRDQRLLASVLLSYREHHQEDVRIGVLYGAAHIPPVIRLLTDKLSYRVENATWETVFEL